MSGGVPSKQKPSKYFIQRILILGIDYNSTGRAGRATGRTWYYPEILARDAAASATGARKLHLMETLLLLPLLLKEPPLTGRNPGGHIHPQYLPLLEHKAEKWRLPPIFQSHTNASYWQSLTNTSRQGDLGNVVSRLPGPCATQRRPWKSEKEA